MFFAHGVSATNRCFRVLWAGLGRHNVTDRRETFCVPHGDIHKTEGNHANLAAVGVGVWIDQQINRAPFPDQQIRRGPMPFRRSATNPRGQQLVYQVGKGYMNGLPE